MRVRALYRRNWRAWVGLGLAFAVAGGMATAAAAGARRTETAYPRFYEAHGGAHVVTGGLAVDDPAEAEAIQRQLRELPGVVASAQQSFVTDRVIDAHGVTWTFPQVFISGDRTGSLLHDVSRPKVLRGRMFRNAADDEAVIDLLAAERTGIDVGDVITPLLNDPETREPSLPRPVTVVGVVLPPGGIVGIGEGSFASVIVSKGYLDANADAPIDDFDGPYVRLRDASQIPAYIKAAREVHASLDIPITSPRHLEGVRKMLRYDTAAMWLLSALLAFSALVILGQMIARQLTVEAEDHRTLAALGMRRGAIIGSDLVRATVAGLVGAVVSVPIAIALSALTPRGLARLAEPTPGFSVDAGALALGALATVIAAMFVAMVPAFRLTRAHGARSTRPSKIAAALARLGAGPAAVAGTRLALDPGRGHRSIPVHSAIAAVTTAVAAITAAITFTTSLDTLIGRPDLYGFTWDVLALSEDSRADAELLAADDDVEASTLGGYGSVTIGEHQLLPLLYESDGPIGPTVLEGRAPHKPDEIALASGIMRKLNVDIGDRVDVRAGPDGGQHAFEIVGRVVVPPIFFQMVEPGESSAMTLEGYERIVPPEERDRFGLPHLVRFKPGTDLNAKIAEMRAASDDLFVGQIREAGGELTALARSRDLPILLTIALIALAIASLTHTLRSSIRTRRKDLAILRSLGFVARQVRATVRWQASTLVVLGLIAGIPLGLTLGRWGWRWFADSIGVIPHPTTPLLIAGVLLPAAWLLFANAMAMTPARSVARTSPAEVLRVE
jgi:ABC-type lipoprotein release transport system permease subunit